MSKSFAGAMLALKTTDATAMSWPEVWFYIGLAMFIWALTEVVKEKIQ